MSDIFQVIEAAGEADKKAQKIDLGPISVLADKQAALESKALESRVNLVYSLCEKIGASVLDIEEALKKRKKDLFNIRQIQIPELMKEFGLESLKTNTGASIEIKGGVSVSIKDNKKLFKYVRDCNSGDLIKNVIIIEASDDGTREGLITFLEESFVPFEQKESIHSATLKKFVKEQIESGKKPPENAVNTFEYNFSKLKKAKK